MKRFKIRAHGGRLNRIIKEMTPSGSPVYKRTMVKVGLAFLRSALFVNWNF
jgi:hypothetical protein